MQQQKPQIPDSIAQYVAELGPAVTSADVDTLGKLQDIRDQSHLIHTILDSWSEQQLQDRQLRGNYAFSLIIAMGAQAAFVDVVFVLIGAGKLNVDPWTARTFIMAVFGELAAMIWFILKYLFKPSSDKVLELIKSNGKSRQR